MVERVDVVSGGGSLCLAIAEHVAEFTEHRAFTFGAARHENGKLWR